MRDFKKGTARYKEAFKGIAVSANPNYRGPAIKKTRTVRPEHQADKRSKSKPPRKSSAIPPEVKAAALQLAHEVLVPMFEKPIEENVIDLFADSFTKKKKEAEEIIYRKRASRALRFMREGKLTRWTGKRNARVRLSGYEKFLFDRIKHLLHSLTDYEKFLCDRIEHLLHSLTDIGQEIFDDACLFIESLPDELMGLEERKSTYNTLKSIKRLLRKASVKGRGAPTGKVYDLGLAAAVAQVAKGFGLRPRRGTEFRGEANADRVSACSVVREKLEEMLLNTPGDFIKPLTESEVEASYERGKRHPLFSGAFRFGVLERLDLVSSAERGQPFHGPWDDSLRDLIPFDISEHDLRILECAVNANHISGVQV
jgi:hypothetical protein